MEQRPRRGPSEPVEGDQANDVRPGRLRPPAGAGPAQELIDISEIEGPVCTPRSRPPRVRENPDWMPIAGWGVGPIWMPTTAPPLIAVCRDVGPQLYTGIVPVCGLIATSTNRDRRRRREPEGEAFGCGVLLLRIDERKGQLACRIHLRVCASSMVSDVSAILLAFDFLQIH